MPTAGTLSKLASFPDSRLRILNAENGLLIMMESLDQVLAHYGYKMIRRRGWKRPRRRVHPAKPKIGLRATRPNEYWQIDATVIRLTTGMRIYLQAVIDNSEGFLLGG